jgi:hypothetical protein
LMLTDYFVQVFFDGQSARATAHSIQQHTGCISIDTESIPR